MAMITYFNTEASMGADLFELAGIAKKFVQMVPARAMDRDHTCSSAAA